jgi:hypothetical protein
MNPLLSEGKKGKKSFLTPSKASAPFSELIMGRSYHRIETLATCPTSTTKKFREKDHETLNKWLSGFPNAI